MSEEEGIGERPDAAGDGRDRGRNLTRRREVNVADEMAVDHVDAHIDDHGAWLEHVAGDETGVPGGHDDDVGEPGMGREIPRPRVADRDRGAGLGEHERDGHADNRGAADHDGLCPYNRGAGSFQDFERSVRSGGNEALEPEPEQPSVEGMDAIDVLGRVDRVDHGPDADALGEWHLHDDPRNLVIAAQGAHCGREFARLTCRIVSGHIDQTALDTDRRTGLENAVEVHHGRRRPATDHDREARRVALLASEGGDILGDAGADLVGDRASLEEAGPGLNSHAGIRQRCRRLRGPRLRCWRSVSGVPRRPRLHGSSRQGS